MKKIIFLPVIILTAFVANAQYTIKLSVQSGNNKMPLAGATAVIYPQNKTTIADSFGVVTFF